MNDESREQARELLKRYVQVDFTCPKCRTRFTIPTTVGQEVREQACTGSYERPHSRTVMEVERTALVTDEVAIHMAALYMAERRKRGDAVIQRDRRKAIEFLKREYPTYDWPFS